MTEFSSPYRKHSLFAKGRDHLRLQVAGKTLGYAYIRKNGCFSFKDFLGYPKGTDVGSILKNHRFNRHDRCDHLIFIYRDPLSRMKSLYQHKFIDKDGHEDITRAYRQHMGTDHVTFSSFLSFAGSMKDPHCYTQSSHLFPRRYTNAINLSSLYQGMAELIGEEHAEAFRHKKNTSTPPSFIVTDDDIALVRKIYRSDYKMIDAINRSS